MLGLGYVELLIILVIVLLLFGGRKLPELAGSLGKGLREFKTGLREEAAAPADAPEGKPALDEKGRR